MPGVCRAGLRSGGDHGDLGRRLDHHQPPRRRQRTGGAHVRPVVRRHHRQRGHGAPRQERCDRTRGHVHAGRRTPPGGGRAGRRQDQLGQGARRLDRLRVEARAVHARPVADRSRGCERVSALHRDLPLRTGPAVRQHRPGRRDQPGVAEDPVGTPRGDGGTADHRRRRQPPPRRPVHGHRHPEPGRPGGHLPAARKPARPLPVPHHDRLPRPHRRDPDARQPGLGSRAAGDRTGRLDRRGPADDRGGERHLCGQRAQGLPRRPRRSQPPAPRHRARPVAAGHPATGSGRPRACRRAGTKLRDTRRRQGGRARHVEPPHHDARRSERSPVAGRRDRRGVRGGPGTDRVQ